MNELEISIEYPRIPQYRDTYGPLDDLKDSVAREGLRHPITLWSDGTVISGARRLRAHFLLSNDATGGAGKYQKIGAVLVDNIEDATKRLLVDNADTDCALPLKYSEICKLWAMLRRFDEPAALWRAVQGRRQGVALRKQTIAGTRPPGRTPGASRGEEYVMSILAQPFGMSESTASRLWAIFRMSTSPAIAPERRTQACEALAAIDAGSASIAPAHSALVSGRRVFPAPPRAAEKTTTLTPAATSAAKQLAAWTRSIPQMEGLTAGLVDLGTAHPDLTPDQVASVVARLSAVRRDLEKIIKSLKKEIAQS